MVDRDRLYLRLDRLAELLDELTKTRAGGIDAYLFDEVLRAATERRLQLAQQICIDVGASLISELNLRAANDYSEVFKRLAAAEVIEAALAGRLGDAARQRNLLVHMYLDIDDRKVFATLEHLDDLRDFAGAVVALLGEANSGGAG